MTNLPKVKTATEPGAPGYCLASDEVSQKAYVNHSATGECRKVKTRNRITLRDGDVIHRFRRIRFFDGPLCKVIESSF